MELLQQQYQLAKESRAVVLRFLADEVKYDAFKPVAPFSDKTIAWMLVHIANTYLFWTGNFSLKLNLSFYSANDIQDINDVEKLFGNIDALLQQFIQTFGENLQRPIAGLNSAGAPVHTHAFAVFTHVLTHEFHHKGQIMSMCRLLGHVPPDADIIR